MDYATIFVGFDPEYDNEPVVKADGKLLGTVEQVRKFIADWEKAQPSAPEKSDA